MKFAILGISLIVVGVVLYGIFATTQSKVETGQTTSTETHGGALTWMQGILNGLHLNVVGK